MTAVLTTIGRALLEAMQNGAKLTRVPRAPWHPIYLLDGDEQVGKGTVSALAAMGAIYPDPPDEFGRQTYRVTDAGRRQLAAKPPAGEPGLLGLAL